ncbi:MAG TPA: hypothetical protein VNB49_10475 [Candidatus Dormibacteraeota bacterium]|nr:hypothetical protein [Candidatus Dormibacteraeota bacterium]
MFGLFCKGLHCAGCGKGIPAGAVITLAAAAILGNGAVANVLGNVLIALASIAAAFFVVAMAIAGMVYRNGASLVTWRSPTNLTARAGTTPITIQARIEKVPEWPYHPMLDGVDDSDMEMEVIYDRKLNNT